jgi:hypothetical protein
MTIVQKVYFFLPGDEMLTQNGLISQTTPEQEVSSGGTHMTAGRRSAF